MKNLIIIFLAPIALTGCASQLVVYDSAGKTLPGYPVPTPVTFVETGIYTQLIKGGACQRASYSTYVTEPVGPTVFVNVKPAQLAKTALDVKMSSSGIAQEISLNTEPSASDVISSTADAIKTVAPLVGLAAADAVAQAKPPAVAPISLPCDTAPDPATIQRAPLKVG